jgi:hypothetical protein
MRQLEEQNTILSRQFKRKCRRKLVLRTVQGSKIMKILDFKLDD